MKTKKQHHHKRTVKRAIQAPEHHATRAHVDKEPEYMVQLGDPKVLRKDLLESLREVIIFMQGYETFRKIQEEKVALFTILKSEVKEINALIEGKLKRYLPKGKLHLLSEKQIRHQDQLEELPTEPQRVEVVPIERPLRRDPTQRTAPPSELEELEKQLRDIETQLQNIN
ncbi:hypothetical protein HY496_01080 [Candidatus Woesearchaeota archaeon]|nr:hypothetical protein [Candidatus Woesearchaeota archaeon]